MNVILVKGVGNYCANARSMLHFKSTEEAIIKAQFIFHLRKVKKINVITQLGWTKRGRERVRVREGTSEPNRCVGSCQYALLQAGGHLEA